MGSRKGRKGRKGLEGGRFFKAVKVINDPPLDHPVPQQPRPQLLVQGKRPLYPDPGNLILLDAFDLCVLCALCASLFPGPKWVRAKDAKDAKG